MNLLSLDLGLTSGYAVIKDQGDLYAHGTIPFQELPSRLAFIMAAHSPRWVFAETPVIIRGSLGEQLTWVVEQVRALVPDVKEIEAARWKNSWWKSASLPRGMSQHERDAIRMGWYLLDEYLKTANVRANVFGNDDRA